MIERILLIVMILAALGLTPAQLRLAELERDSAYLQMANERLIEENHELQTQLSRQRDRIMILEAQ